MDAYLFLAQLFESIVAIMDNNITTATKIYFPVSLHCSISPSRRAMLTMRINADVSRRRRGILNLAFSSFEALLYAEIRTSPFPSITTNANALNMATIIYTIMTGSINSVILLIVLRQPARLAQGIGYHILQLTVDTAELIGSPFLECRHCLAAYAQHKRFLIFCHIEQVTDTTSLHSRQE